MYEVLDPRVILRLTFPAVSLAGIPIVPDISPMEFVCKVLLIGASHGSVRQMAVVYPPLAMLERKPDPMMERI
jgi:hypothetical protein